MTKNIILLSDGTGNAASSPHKTNVWRLYKALDLSPAKGENNQQFAFYDDGVGTSKFLPTRLIGLAFGWGLKKNVKELYLNLCRVYSEGDNIFIFGFSRGAFTARFVAALIGSQGLVKHDGDEKKLRKKVNQAYINFRLKGFGWALVYLPFWLWYSLNRPTKSKQLKDSHKANGDGTPLIKMIGVWDTVDAYGAPFDELTNAWDTVIWPLTAKDRDLSYKVGAAYQALALDEQRETFNPMLWNEAAKPKNSSQILEQVWFSGVHANLGGGYPDDSLAHVSLNWMIKKCEDQDLHFIDNILATYHHAQDPYGKIYNNRSGFGNIYRYAPRKIEELCDDDKTSLRSRLTSKYSSFDTVDNIVRVDYPKIHETVFDRIENSGDAYAPIGLPEHYCVVDNNGNQNVPADEPENPKAKNSKPRAPETQQEAKLRRDKQGSLWKQIWFGKILYILTVLFTISYVTYPWVLSDSDIQQRSQLTGKFAPFVGELGDVIQVLPKAVGLIPGLGLVGDWASRYRNIPYEFVFGAFILIGLLCSARILQRHISENMRLNWAHVSKQGSPAPPPASYDRTKFYDSRLHYAGTNKKLKLSPLDKIQRMGRKIIEGLFVILLSLIVFLGIWKVTYIASDGLGFVCKAPQKSSAEIGTKINFLPTETCFDTGVDIQKDKQYLLEFEIDRQGIDTPKGGKCMKGEFKHPWCDSGVAADARGFLGSTPFLLLSMSHLKRHVTKDWFEPIARIGNNGYYRFSFEPEEGTPHSPNSAIWKTRVKINPTRNGRLYLYLNDAVAPPIIRNVTPVVKNCISAPPPEKGEPTEQIDKSEQPEKAGKWMFYSNNCGIATITVEEVAKKEAIATPPS